MHTCALRLHFVIKARHFQVAYYKYKDFEGFKFTGILRKKGGGNNQGVEDLSWFVQPIN